MQSYSTMHTYPSNFFLYQYKKITNPSVDSIKSNELHDHLSTDTTLYGTGEIPYRQKRSKKCWKAFLEKLNSHKHAYQKTEL